MSWPKEADAVLTFKRKMTPQQIMGGSKPEVLRAWHWKPEYPVDGIILRRGEKLKRGDLIVCRDDEPVIKWIMHAEYFAENYK